RNCRAVEKVCFFANANAKVPGIYIQNGKQEDLYLKAPLRTGDTWTDAGGTRATLVEFRAVSLQGQKHNKCLVIEVNFGEGYEELDAIQEVLCPELGVVQVFRHEGKSWVEDKQLTEHVRR